MNRHVSIVLVVIAVTPASAQQPPSYAKQIRPFLAKYCLECHNAKAAKGGLILESYKDILEGSNKGEVLLPGNPDKSRLLKVLDGKTKPVMPPPEAKFRPKADEIALLREWIKAGAKDDSKDIKVAIPDIKPRKQAVPPVVGLAYDPQNGNMIAARGRSLLSRGPPRIFNSPRHFEEPLTAIGCGMNGVLFAAAYGKPGESGNVQVALSAGQGGAERSLTAHHPDSILALAIGGDANRPPSFAMLATAGYDSTIKLVRLDEGFFRDGPTKPPPKILKEHSDAVYDLAFSPDGKLLASCSADRTVKVWEVATGKLLYTLGEATDWLYALAWSPDGEHLASGGVDRSIRVYQVSADKGKIAQSVFAHEGAVQKLAYSKDGKTLYSLGQDRIVKAWDAGRMIERKVHERLPETALALAVRDGEIAIGLYDGSVRVIDEATGKIETVNFVKPASQQKSPKAVDPFPSVKAEGGMQSPASGQKVSLPASVSGVIDRAGGMHFFRLEVARGQQLGVRLVTKALNSKLEPLLTLTDDHGNMLAEGTEALGYTFTRAGSCAIGVRDRELRGGADMKYRLDLGDIPVVSSLFPLGGERGTDIDLQLKGVFLGTEKVRVKIPADVAVGSKIPVPLTTSKGKPLGPLEIVVGEFPPAKDGVIPVPGTADGILAKSEQQDTWRFAAKKGERLILEVHGRRLGSPIDSVIEVLDESGQLVPRAVLRCQAKTYVTFRDHDSAGANIRIESWNELAINDYLYVGGELMKIKELPTHPDADCIFFSAGGQRTGFLDTTPTHHAHNTPMYKVTIHPAGTTFPPNGYPVFTLYYRNDDGGPGFGRDSRLFFDPPADGTYQVRIRDARGMGGENFAYRLTVRPPRPSFNVRFSPTNSAVAKGGAQSINITADRIDGYDGPIILKFVDVPPGFHVPTTNIESGEHTTAISLYAEPEAMTPSKPAPLRLVAEAEIDGQRVTKEATGESPRVVEPGEIMTAVEESEVLLHPGGQTKVTVRIERRQGFQGRVPLEVRGLPHGVRVLDIGLNGILINENENRRTFVIYAEPWVQPTDHPIVVLAKREGKNTEHAAKSVLLKIAK